MHNSASLRRLSETNYKMDHRLQVGGGGGGDRQPKEAGLLITGIVISSDLSENSFLNNARVSLNVRAQMPYSL